MWLIKFLIIIFFWFLLIFNNWNTFLITLVLTHSICMLCHMWNENELSSISTWLPPPCIEIKTNTASWTTSRQVENLDRTAKARLLPLWCAWELRPRLWRFAASYAKAERKMLFYVNCITRNLWEKTDILVRHLFFFFFIILHCRILYKFVILSSYCRKVFG